MKKKIITAAATIPVTAGLAMSGVCAGGCPYGLVNDPYPGQCPRYADMDGDGICDLSQATTASQTTTTATTDPTASNSAASTGNSGSNSNGDDGSSIELEDLGNGDDFNASAFQDSGVFGNSSVDPTNYHAVPVSILLIAGYLFTHLLFSKGVLSRKKHRRIWNLLLTAGYAGTGITGILLIFIVNLGISSILNNSISFLHAEMAILMVVGTLIHAHLYKKPIKRMFRAFFLIKSGSKEKNVLNSMDSSK